MTIDERSRHALYLRLEEVLGADEAGTLMDHLPPVGWADVATRRDVDGASVLLRSEMASEFAAVRSEMASEFAAVRRDITVLQSDVVGIRTEMRAMEQSLTGLFRMELAQAITSQTRTLVVTMITLLVAGMSLAFAAARIS